MRRPPLSTLTRAKRIVQLLVLGILIMIPWRVFAVSYTLKDLGIPFPGATGITGAALNDAGDAAGGTSSSAFIYANGEMSGPVGTVPGGLANFNYALGINAAGTVTGASQMSALYEGGPASHAFIYNDGTWTDITPLGLQESSGTGINSKGQVSICDGCVLFTFVPPQCFIYSPVSGETPSTTVNIGALAGDNGSNIQASCWAYGINDSGQVTGEITGPVAPNGSAFVYTPGSAGMPGNIVALGVLGGDDSSAGFAINATGQVTGVSSSATANHAFLYSPGAAGAVGTMISLGTLGTGNEGPYSAGHGINNSGLVVGETSVGIDQGVHGFLWDGAAMLDLNTLIPAPGSTNCLVTLTKGDAINDAGTILADGVDCNGAQHAFLLLPPNEGSANPCDSNTTPEGTYRLCILPPYISTCGVRCLALCGIQCVFHQPILIGCPECNRVLQYVWSMPTFTSDSWADGTSVNLISFGSREAQTIVNGLKVTVSTESRIQSRKERLTRIRLLSGGADDDVSHAATIVAPIVEITLASDKQSDARRSSTSYGLFLPYHEMSRRLPADERLARFNPESHGWSEVPHQSRDATKHSIYARISRPGRFTILEVATQR